MNPYDLIELLQGHTVYIQTHNFPDPDAISSAFGLHRFLQHYNIHSIMCYDGRIERLNVKQMLHTFQIQLTNAEDLTSMKTSDYIILVDSQKSNSNITNLPGTVIACIDHHPMIHQQDFSYLYSDVQKAGACASIIASYYAKTNTPIPPQVGAALAYGIKMDTDDFLRGTSKLDTEMFSYLYDYADWDLLEKMYHNTLEFNDLEAYAAAINSIQIFDKTGFAFIPFDCPQALVAIISDFILSLTLVDLVVIYALQENCVRFSVRSERKNTHAGELIQKALKGIGNGGGHPAMAGGVMTLSTRPDSLDSLQEFIQERFLHVL